MCKGTLKYMKLLTGLVIFVTQTAVGGTAVLSGGHDRKLSFVSDFFKSYIYSACTGKGLFISEEVIFTNSGTSHKGHSYQ